MSRLSISAVSTADPYAIPRCRVKFGELPKVYPSAMFNWTETAARCSWENSADP